MNAKTEKQIRLLLDHRQSLPFSLAIVVWQELEALRAARASREDTPHE